MAQDGVLGDLLAPFCRRSLGLETSTGLSGLNADELACPSLIFDTDFDVEADLVFKTFFGGRFFVAILGNCDGERTCLFSASTLISESLSSTSKLTWVFAHLDAGFWALSSLRFFWLFYEGFFRLFIFRITRFFVETFDFGGNCLLLFSANLFPAFQ